MSATLPQIEIPADLRPSDGRFGSGPSLVRQEAVDALAAAAPTYLGTSHRQPAVQFVVGALRNGLAEMFALPDGYEIILGNGGTTVFWDAALFGLIERRSQHLSFGEFSSKFAAGAAAAPFLDDPIVISSEPGTHPELAADPSVDLYALTQNETSTGVMMPLARPAGISSSDALVAVDATSAAGGLRFDAREVDVYYFAPQKALASDGGLWIAAVSPAAIERIERIAASDRWIPTSIDLKTALDNSRKDQTYNTPALATLFLTVQQVEWINGNGGLEWAASRCDRSAEAIYGWAERSSVATPFVADPAARSHTVATIDLDDAVDATTVSKVLAQNGVLDTFSYRKLGRNQLRIALFPAIDPADVEALTRCIDFVVERLA
ncbi:phosphoserine transaminase [Actinomarinicola tropica]|uniref:phosphoserine transaminase n=1 Tax=Actinomarinicola tropica TaxID=2789776 RepID=A0A5Q2RGB7_9ACTN|nr:phosphoserine transaminase [Actinomarinicola tropica]QGG94684.1 phosphoserine transaminase [Actinomarinicola tropica]